MILCFTMCHRVTAMAEFVGAMTSAASCCGARRLEWRLNSAFRKIPEVIQMEIAVTTESRIRIYSAQEKEGRVHNVIICIECFLHCCWCHHFIYIIDSCSLSCFWHSWYIPMSSNCFKPIFIQIRRQINFHK